MSITLSNPKLWRMAATKPEAEPMRERIARLSARLEELRRIPGGGRQRSHIRGALHRLRASAN